MALAITAFRDRKDAKESLPLAELQRGYIANLEAIFGELYTQMLEWKATPHQVASFLSNDSDSRPDYIAFIPEFMNWINDLWGNAYEVSNYHIQDMHSLKAVFGGDLFPSNERNIASTCGVYIDTIVLPDPFLRSEYFINNGPDKQRVYYFIKHGLNILQYKDLITSDLDVPIVAIVPDKQRFDEWELEALRETSEYDALQYVNKIFGLPFDSVEDALVFSNGFADVSTLLNNVKDKSLLIYDMESNKPIETQMGSIISQQRELTGSSDVGTALFNHTFGRMMQANDLRRRSSSLGGAPLMDAPTSWHYFQWKLKFDAERIDPELRRNLHIVQGLQTASKGEMTWLGNIPPAALIEMRKCGAIHEIRDVLSKGVSELVALNYDNFSGTSELIVRNMSKAFDDHKERIHELRGKKWRFAGIEVGLCAVKGIVSIVSACGVPGVSIINNIIDETTNTPKLKELPDKLKILQEQSKQLEKSPVGLLFSVADNP